MRTSFAEFMAAVSLVGAPRQFIFVALDLSSPGEASPIFVDDPERLWAIVDDEKVIQQQRTFVPAEDRIWLSNPRREVRIDYDERERPTLIVHDMR